MCSQTRWSRWNIRISHPVIWILCWINNANAGFIDPDTPIEFQTMKPFTIGDNHEYELVFSDEFDENGRNVKDGNDPRWCAVDKNDYTNAALHFYSEDNVVTSNGVLNITVERKVNDYRAYDEKKKLFYNDKKYVQSGMVQSWNKFCFIGGIVEFSAKLPGDPQKGGLWPALWMLGNLARATYVGTSDFVWPFSYNQCDTKTQKTQQINACNRVQHYGLSPYVGRGSPEIDILESMQGDSGPLPSTHIEKPYQSTSLQVAPGVEMNRPVLGLRPPSQHWYHHLEYSPTNKSDINPFFYGVTLVHSPKSKTYQSDAISANRQLNKTHYEKQHKYRIEWEPPNENGEGGYVKWYTDDELVFGLNGESLDLTRTEIPSEPMYLIMNVAVSHTWGFPICPDGCDCTCYECDNPACKCGLPNGYCDNFPANFEIDYVRVWQAKNNSRHILGCSPEHRPTEQFIQGRAEKFMTEGQKQPLEPTRNGGGVCIKHTDCGSKLIMGSCISGVCVCQTNYTGPKCKTSDGTYDFDTRQPQPRFSWNKMEVPGSLLILLGALITGFLIAVVQTKRSKILQVQYEKIGETNRNNLPNGNSLSIRNGMERAADISSYQDSAAVYAMPSGSKKDVTYCVIDGRLVDNT